MNRETSPLTAAQPSPMDCPGRAEIRLRSLQLGAFCGLVLLCLLRNATAEQGFALEELEAALKQEPTNKPVLLEVVRRYHKLLLESPTDAIWKSADRHFDTLNTVYDLYRLRRGAKVDALALAYFSSYKVLRYERLTRKGSRPAKSDVGTPAGGEAKGAPDLEKRTARGSVAVWLSRSAGGYGLMKGEALGDLDLAVQTEPGNLEIRLVRASNGIALRGKERLAQSVEDLRYVILACERDPQKGKDLNLPGLYLLCGKCAKRGDSYVAAFDVWHALVEKYPDSAEAKEAAELLRQLKSKSGGQPKPKEDDGAGEGR